MSPSAQQPFDDDERALSRALHEQVDPMNDSPLGLGDVQRKAGAVRRRRRIATGAAVAAAVAVLAPTAVIAGRSLGGDEGPGPATATATAEPTAEPTPTTTPSEPAPTPTETPSVAAGTQPFDVSDLPTGAEPAIEWSDGADVHRADGSVVPGVLPAGADQFAPMGSGWMVAFRDEDGRGYVQWVPASGVSTAEVYELDGGIATSREGEVVAWVQPDGLVQVVQRDGDERYQLPLVAAPGPYTAVGVSSEDCKEGRSSDSGCAVFVNTLGEQPQAWATTTHGFSDRYDEETLQFTAWWEGGYAGITEFREDMTTCSAARDPMTFQSLWETCDHRLVEYSPSGAHLLGVGSIGDGFGDGQVALLDAADGTVLVDLLSDEDHQSTAVQLTWEDEDSALMVVYADGAWSVVRLNLDGSLEYAVPPREAPMEERPFFLQS